ncbi:ubiquitin carboxyl-terminal hydrolase 20 [Adelges cooleyi]|uniref:ubiquitin carboxyl-terminal hydrolase 20 n=1 Tax=Adelges cooleyi TaxID=133065 RepID=UPI00217F8A89|nr:ubiquitin carboxyl-terminal hydrolase 20 [Adelges cooleyi]XP_050443597.1 ubiquitin carboxyl-terminal hydrolase 20 [Adelges cooleyi]XP_050443598.1 ubiquitin carboxyl-terminal hydrolase 20 [Adelges cooleyi]
MEDCPHFTVHHLTAIDKSINLLENHTGVLTCYFCQSKKPEVWVCINPECMQAFCFDGGCDHSYFHFTEDKTHCLHLSLPSMRLCCYICDKEYNIEKNPRTLNGVRRGSNCSIELCRNNVVASNSGESAEEDSDDEYRLTKDHKPTGLTGLQNIGNTCYMNAALQALSNTPPLTEYFLTCFPENPCHQSDNPLHLSRAYHRLLQEIWHTKRPGYVTPTTILYTMRNVYPMFRGFHQHDTQEFLRCFMDQLHEELKECELEVVPSRRHSYKAISRKQSLEQGHLTTAAEDNEEECSDNDELKSLTNADSSSEGLDEYETCDSGVSERSSLSEEMSERMNLNKQLQQHLITKMNHGNKTNLNQKNLKVHFKYNSIISEIFDGKLLSSVQCLTCNRVSSRVEAFQDLSLPIPTRDHVTVLHQSSSTNLCSVHKLTDVYTNQQVVQNWIFWFWDMMYKWFWGPTVGLHDCLAAFFSADELKGDNMYSCEKCKKLRNGIKFSKLLELPEVLCIHLKRFRHELMFSSKITSYVTFPIDGLDLRPYVHKDCTSQVTTYKLVSVICHHGTIGSGGHYTCYSLNPINEQWYEFDDQCVTLVSAEIVRNSEAYVLFYKKNSPTTNRIRTQMRQVQINKNQPSCSQEACFISTKWLSKFNSFAEPGPIDNYDFMCHHNRVKPTYEPHINHYATMVSGQIWDYLYSKFGGGPKCTNNQLQRCEICYGEYMDMLLKKRAENETKHFSRLGEELNLHDMLADYAISMCWFKRWEAFLNSVVNEPPGPIDNIKLLSNSESKVLGTDYISVSEGQWDYLWRIYSGGPMININDLQMPVSNVESDNHFLNTSSDELCEVNDESQNCNDRIMETEVKEHMVCFDSGDQEFKNVINMQPDNRTCKKIN